MEEQVTPIEQVVALVDAANEPEVVLPSDEIKFEMPEKFAGKTAEEIAKSYIELEALKTKEAEPPKETPDEETPTPDATTTDLIEEYAARGTDLTEEDYKVLEEKGYSKRQVDLYKAGYQAEVAQKATELLTTAGTTADEAASAANWARENWSEERVTQYNAAIETASPEVQVQMIQMLTEQFRTAGPKVEPQDQLHASTNPAPTSKGYTSMEQLITDQSNPKYDQRSFSFDQSYYDAVRAKAARSSL